ncbi:MAG: peptidoglycan DD-metalloendopeptidase family protein [Hymenobacteraceae bacterium]|nr:peptidoglycan DD-metalloendopeptidase family protein [Hymenobacteraceae bacterium]
MPSSFRARLGAAPVAAVLPTLDLARAARLDFTAANPRLTPENLRGTATFDRLVHQMLAEQGATAGWGGYLEERVIYRRSPELFGEAGPARSLHLGIDVWCPAGTPVATPLPATIYSVQDNAGFGDYGPTVILEHQLDEVTFWSLYGHLGRAETETLQSGQLLAAGDSFATVGPWPENGDWPPHLHFQLMTDLLGKRGDFPGVAVPAERAYWAAICPDPNLVLRCNR